MRFLCCVVFSLALWGCESDVDLCGGGAVCGVDGNRYGSYCEAGAAGIDVVYAGECNGTCSDISCRIDCQYGLSVDAEGCPICECAPPPTCMNEAPCTRGDVCVDGRCAPPVDLDAGTDTSFDVGGPDAPMTCDDGEILCDGECVSLGTVENCTTCDDVCGAPEHGTATCDRTTGCGFDCDPGYGNCDTGTCELLDTKENCGACGNSCARFGGCDFDPDDMTATCVCPAGRIDCDGTCINPENDGEFCGGCEGPACPEGTRCQARTCSDAGGPACTNPANWYCAEGPDNCDVACGGINFFGDPLDGSFTCTVGGVGISCFVPPGANCDTCIDIASRCCLGG